MTSEPADWTSGTIESLTAAIIDYRGKTPQKTTSGIPLVTAKIIKGGRLKEPTEFIAAADYDTWMRRGLPRVGDVLITTEAPMGEVAQLRNSDVALAQRVILLRGQDEILDNTFLKFVLQSSPVQEQLRARSSGTTVTGIKQRELRKVILPVPPLIEQRRIAAVLGALDDKIELNREMKRTLEEIAQAIFKSWFIDFDDVPPEYLVDSELGRIPHGWQVKPLSSCIELAYGKSLPKKKRTPGAIPVYGSGGVGGTHNEAIVDGPGIIVGRKGSVGTVFWEDDPFFPIDTTFYVTPLSGPAWLPWIYFQLDRLDIQRLGADSAVPGVNRRTLLAQQWVVPPAEMIEKFSAIRAPLQRRMKALAIESATLVDLRDTLLPKLISGEIRVPEGELGAGGTQ